MKFVLELPLLDYTFYMISNRHNHEDLILSSTNFVEENKKVTSVLIFVLIYFLKFLFLYAEIYHGNKKFK